MIEDSIVVRERKVAILCSQKRYKEAEEVFMNMVNKKEAQKGWFCSNHAVSNRNGKSNRTYVFSKEENGEVYLDVLYLLTEPELIGRQFDHVICMDYLIDKDRVNGYILTI